MQVRASTSRLQVASDRHKHKHTQTHRHMHIQTLAVRSTRSQGRDFNRSTSSQRLTSPAYSPFTCNSENSSETWAEHGSLEESA